MSNVFNSLSRNALLKSVKDSMLEVYTIWAYSRHSRLVLKPDLTMLSQSGVQQGDPLGMTLFTLAIAGPLKSAGEEHNDVRILAYADDIFLLRSPVNLKRCASDLRVKLSECNLKLNCNKSILWSQIDENEVRNLNLLRTFRQADPVLSVLGIRVARNIHSGLRDAVTSAGASIQPLSRPEDKQGELFILRSAGPYTKVAHLLRAIKEGEWPSEALEELDRYTLGELERIVGAPLPDNAAKRALLPLSFGGLGLSRATDSTKNCFLFQTGLNSINEKLSLLRGFETLGHQSAL